MINKRIIEKKENKRENKMGYHSNLLTIHLFHLELYLATMYFPFSNNIYSLPKSLNFSEIGMAKLKRFTTSFAMSYDLKILCVYQVLYCL